jgi:hypothetical protein
MSDTKLLELESIKKTRILHRRNGRMKIQFNLTKEEGEAFQNFFKVINQPDMTEEQFSKTAFMIGLQQMERAIIQRMTEEAQKQAESEGAEPEIVEDETEKTEE